MTTQATQDLTPLTSWWVGTESRVRQSPGGVRPPPPRGSQVAEEERAAESRGTRPQKAEGEVRKNRKGGAESMERQLGHQGLAQGNRHWRRRGPSGSPKAW